MTEPIILTTPEQLSTLVRDAVRAEAALMTGNGPKEVLNLEECAELLSRHPKTVTRLTTEEGLPVTYISEREPRFFRSEIIAWLRSRATKPKQLEK